MSGNNLLSLQQKFNNLGATQLGNEERDRFAMTDRQNRNEWNAQRQQPNSFYQKRNTTQPGNQQFKKRSNSNIGKGSRLASNPRDEEYPPRIGKSSMSYVQQQQEAERISRLSFNSGGLADQSSPSILDTWNQVPKQLKQVRRNPQSFAEQDQHHALTPNYRRPNNFFAKESSIDDNQRRLDDMMLFNSQKQQKLLSNERQRFQPPVSPNRFGTLTAKRNDFVNVNKVYTKPIVDRRGHFEEQDMIRSQVNKIWIRHDINRSGALDKVETANFLRDFCASNGKPAPNMQTFSRFFFDYDKNRDGLIQKSEMARFIRDYLDATRDEFGAAQIQSDEFIRDQVDKVWFYYDVDHSGYLDKIETHQFLKHFMKEHNLPAPTMASFNKFFYDHDVNGDGVISKKEMARFFKNFVNDPLDDYVMQKVNEIWFKYDIDRSGYLDKRETLIFLKELLNQHHQKPPTALSFNKWFAEHDLNNDGHISKKEMAPFVRKFFNSPLSQADTIDEMVVEFFDKYDTNRNGVLERREALKMLNEILARQGKPSASMPYFNRLFTDIDLNCDGVISKQECALFIKNYCNVPIQEDEDVQIMVMNIFNKYDDNRNGYLEKRETLGLLNEILANRGQQPATVQQFNRFFHDIDLNRDGVISKGEMTEFVKNFLSQPITAQENIDMMVVKIFDKFDSNGNGYLEKKECLRFLNDILANKGQPPATFTQFNKFFSEIDDNGDGVISRSECSRFVRKFLGMPPTEEDKIANKINDIWYNYDVDRNGFLSRMETLRFLNDFLAEKGQPPATMASFNRFFNDLDVNGDDVISRPEMAKFVSNFLQPVVSKINDENLINDMVQKIFMKYDVNRSGYLEKRETLRLVDDLLAAKGQPPATVAQFNRFFAEHDYNGDGILSRSEMTRFAKKFIKNQELIPVNEIQEIVNQIWFKYDIDRSGFLNRRETLKFLNDFLVTKGQSTASIPQFNRFFEEMDLNKDGYVSKQEMARFVRNYMNPSKIVDQIEEMTIKLFMKYDVNRSGFLDKREALVMLDELLMSQGKQKTTIQQFNRFFAEFDINSDGVISKTECARFVKKFFNLGREADLIDELVIKLFIKYDVNRSGFLDRREVLAMLDDIHLAQGREKCTVAQFNRFFAEYDTNNDGLISKVECARLAKQILDDKQNINDLVDKLFMKYDINRSGFLDKREVLEMLDEILMNQGRGKTTIPQFNRFFAQYDANNDGVISRRECAVFVKEFLDLNKDYSIQDKASSLMLDIQLEKERKLDDIAQLRQGRNQVRGPARNELMYSANPLVGTRDNTFDEMDQATNSTLVKKFFDEYHKIIQESIDTGTNLYLLNLLEQLFLIDAEILKEPSLQVGHSRYTNLKQLVKDQKNNLTIQSNTLPEQDHIQTNLFKICCAILNLKPGQRGMPFIDDQLLSQYLDQIVTGERYQSDENLLAQISVIKNLINRKSFSLSDKQIAQIYQKFKNMSIHRQEFIFEMNKANNAKKMNDELPFYYKQPAQRSMHMPPNDLSRIGKKPLRNVSRSPNTTAPMMFDDPLYGPQTARVPATTQKGYKPRKGTWEEDRLGATNVKRNLPICVLSVELDGNNTEKLKVYEGEDPETVVQKFGFKFNLSDNAMRRLLKQIEQQLY